MARTVGSLAILSGLGALVAYQGCVEGVPADYGDVLEQVGPAVVMPRLQSFSAELPALRAAVQAWVDDPSAKEAARTAFGDTMLAWQAVEPLRLGPLAASVDDLGGQNLRDAVYSWPTANGCLVDQRTVARGFDDPNFFDTVEAYGLDALQHLLFQGNDNVCAGQVPINSDGSWDALGPAGVDAARAAYALAVVERLETDSQAAIAAWDGFVPDAVVYGNDRDALDAVFAALFQTEILVTDAKLAEPFGQRNCSADCLELLESQRGDTHLWIAANLRTLRVLFQGGDAAGFDDLLVSRGQGDLAERIDAAFADAITTAEAAPAPLVEWYTTDESAALELLADARAASDLLKDDLTLALALTLPPEVGGDVD